MTPLLLALTLAPALHLTIHADQPTVKVSPSLYGIFFEEINQAGDGGIYSELLRNRGLESTAGKFPVGWSAYNAASLDTSVGLNAAHPCSIRLDEAADGAAAGVRNDGFWGVPMQKGERYRLVVWAKGPGEITALVTSDLAKGLSGSAQIGSGGNHWRRIEKNFTAERTDSQTSLWFFVPHGPAWIGMASLTPVDTWKGRVNGLRKDLATSVADMKPAFVRFPGGCYVEGGDRLSDAFDWKRSVGRQEDRKGLARSMWGYSNTFGLGYHEYLQWCEDMHAEPLFVVNCGMCHKEITPMPEMDKWVQDALDAIEYANGPSTSKWGSLRARNGHPRPFNLKYIEIGNENGANWSFGGPAPYAERYKLVYDAIKKAHPEVMCVADNPVPHPMDIVDEHYYQDPSWFWRNASRYDSYDRHGPQIYVGEYAVTQGCGQGNLAAALGEAAFMTGMERNADIVRMSSYAPLLVNVNSPQWNPNAIVFDNTRSYGTPSYYVQALFSNNRADTVLRSAVEGASQAPAPAPSGSIGLSTWRTSAEFKNWRLDVTGNADAPVGATAAAAYALTDVKAIAGDWKSTDGAIRQSDLGENRSAMATGMDLTGAKEYVIRVDARKLSGSEGFILVLDGGGLTWNVGGWNNTQAAFQRNGAIIGRPVPGKFIETDRWYQLRVVRKANVYRAYLDGKLVQEVAEDGTPDFVAVSGVDAKRHELIVKAVNGSDSAREAQVDVEGVAIGKNGTATVLSGSSMLQENTFAAPRAISPKTSPLTLVSPHMMYTFAPRSVTVLRIPLKSLRHPSL